MSLAELWQLFPISLEFHRPEWSQWAEEEIACLGEILKCFDPVINHIGSTAIEGIVAKPIVDILVEVDIDIDYSLLRRLLEERGYICMASSADRMSFNKGYTPDGYADRVFHIHVRRCGDNAEIRFRDYLNRHREVAREYESLKKTLLLQYRNDRDGYTEAKTPFVERINRLAR